MRHRAWAKGREQCLHRDDGAYNVLAVGTRKDKLAKGGFDPLGLEYRKK